MHSRFRLEKDRDGSEAVTICQRRAKDYLSLHLRCRRPPHHDTDMGDTDRPAQQRTDSLMPDTITAPLTQPVLTRTYEYDHRGNLTKELQEGIPVHSYAYNAMDRLEKAWSHTPPGRRRTDRNRLLLQRTRTARRERHVHGSGRANHGDHGTARRQHGSRRQGRLPPRPDPTLP